MKYHVGLVTYESAVHAWVLDLPGCIAGGRGMDELARMLPLVIAEHVAWLQSHDEALSAHDAWDGTWEVAETIDPRIPADIAGDFCFAADLTPLSQEELETSITRMAYARADLLAAVAGLPDAVLDWEPPPSAMTAFDAWAPEVRTIRGVVEHVLQLEVFYRDGLRDGAAKGIFESVADAVTEREQTVAVLRSLTDAERGRAHRPVRPLGRALGLWTTRKVIRRIISHDRAHAAEVLQRRTWLLLGVPGPAEGPA